jgi:hypothetical protein
MRMRIVAALAVNMTVISHGPTIGQEGDFVARLNAGLDEQIIAMKKQMPIELDQVTKLTDMTSEMGLASRIGIRWHCPKLSGRKKCVKTCLKYI